MIHGKGRIDQNAVFRMTISVVANCYIVLNYWMLIYLFCLSLLLRFLKEPLLHFSSDNCCATKPFVFLKNF